MLIVVVTQSNQGHIPISIVFYAPPRYTFLESLSYQGHASITSYLKRYLNLKNTSYPLNIDYFIWHLTAFRVAAFLKITLMLLKRYKPCSKCYLIALTYDFEQAKRFWNELGADKLNFYHK